MARTLFVAKLPKPWNVCCVFSRETLFRLLRNCKPAQLILTVEELVAERCLSIKRKEYAFDSSVLLCCLILWKEPGVQQHKAAAEIASWVMEEGVPWVQAAYTLLSDSVQ